MWTYATVPSALCFVSKLSSSTISRDVFLMRVVDESQLIANVGIGEGHAAGETRSCGRSTTNCEILGEFFGRQFEERCELFISESTDLKVHKSSFPTYTSQIVMA